MERFSPNAVLDAAIEGEHWALTALFRAYQPPLLRYLRAHQRDMADDLASEIWVAVARRLGDFVGDERGFRSWLFTIARHRVIEHRRNAARRRTDPVSHEGLDRPMASVHTADPADAVVEYLTAEQAIDLLIADLTPSQTEAVLLRVVAGLDVMEVARLMDRSPESVRVLCHRALRRLAIRFSREVLVT
jgi:RNA polymerase sigma-70 factor, ECF subfamily